MRLAELEAVCQEAARNLAGRPQRPVPTSVVLPLPGSTRVLSLPDWPDDDAGRARLLEGLAADVMRPANAPCFGFVAEAVAPTEDGPLDVLLVAYGARRQPSQLTAAPLSSDGLGEFLPSEELDPAALGFLSPLRSAADAAEPPDVTAAGP